MVAVVLVLIDNSNKLAGIMWGAFVDESASISVNIKSIRKFLKEIGVLKQTSFLIK